jgi:putative oxidoreductase
MHIFKWILRLTAAIILLQTLYFKFSAHPDSVYIFTKLGMEPYGRIGTGVLELIASALILVPRTTWLGAGLAAGLMAGAIFSHLTQLGIVLQHDGMNDGGVLFSLAVITFVSALILVWLDRKAVPILNRFV